MLPERSSPRPEPAAPADQLAELLWAARAGRYPLSAADPVWAGLDRARATAVAERLYRRCGADGSTAWKLGALDRRSQDRLGLDSALVAPVLPDGLHRDTTAVTLDTAGLVRPRFEPELGLLHDGSGVRLTGCVEIADCRFADWRPPPAGAVADFGLQGGMVFSPPVPAVDRMRVVVRHDGQVVATADRPVDEAVARLALVGPHWRPGTVVATGAMTPLLDAHPGRWEFEFVDAVTLTVTVR